MPKFEIDIPKERLQRIQDVLGKENVPFERRLVRAIRKAAAQQEFDDFVKAKKAEYDAKLKANEEETAAAIQAKNVELAGEFDTEGDE